MKKADIGVALYLLAAVIFFIVPISSNLLDVMLALNISDRKSTRLNSSHLSRSRMPSSA